MTPIELLRRLSTRGDISDETSRQCDEAADYIARLEATLREAREWVLRVHHLPSAQPLLDKIDAALTDKETQP